MSRAARGKRFNGGVIVLRPNATTYRRLLAEAAAIQGPPEPRAEAERDAKARRAKYYAEQARLGPRPRTPRRSGHASAP